MYKRENGTTYFVQKVNYIYIYIYILSNIKNSIFFFTMGY
jgi:hypothetical protein